MHLKTLGGLALDGHDMRRPKPLLLLAYLCLEGPKSRRFLSELFFPDAVDPSDALSTTLRRLRRIGVVDHLSGNVMALIGCDAVDLLRQLDDGAAEAAAAAYSGRFADGFDAQVGPELEEWLYSTGEMIARRVRRNLLSKAEAAHLVGDRQVAQRVVEAAFVVAGAPEPDVDDLKRMLSLLGDSTSTIADKVKDLAKQSGQLLEPGTESSLTRADTCARLAALPVPLTNLVGRDEELMEVARLLGETDCRLLTLHGPAGVGKSRLAVQAASDLLVTQSFRDGVVFVTTEGLGTPIQLGRAIAKQLGVRIGEGADVWSELAAKVSAARLLCVLDGFEHLTAASPQIRGLLQSCPRIRLLVTSRQRLNIASEWVMPIAGLRVPAEELELNDALLSDAVQLFARRAQAADVQFRVNAENMPLVRRICRAVDGFPLGIELAAAWTRALPLDQIASSIETNLHELGSGQVRGEDSYPDLWAALEHSWHLLDASEQAVFARCAVFKGGFTRAAFESVAHGGVDSLMNLVDKSLVRRSSGGFALHALLGQFAQEKLAGMGDEGKAAAARHAEYFTRLLTDASRGVLGTDLHAAFEVLKEEEANILACLEWAADNAEVQVLLDLAEPLQWYFPMTGGFLAGDACFGSALEKLSGRTVGTAAGAATGAAPGAAATTATPTVHEAWAALLLSRAWLNRYAGSLEPARRQSEEGERLARLAGSKQQLVRALDLRGQVVTYDGSYGEAKRLLHEGVEVAREQGDVLILSRLLTNLGLVEALAGQNSEADRHLVQALEPFRHHQVPVGLDTVAVLLARGVNAWCRKDYEAAERMLRRGHSLAHELDYLGPVPVLAGLLAATVLAQEGGNDKVLEAQTLLGEGLAMVERTREGMGTSLLLGAASALQLHLGNAKRAEEEARRAYTVARDAGNTVIMLWALPQLAKAQAALGEGRRALALCRSVGANDRSPAWVKVATSEMHQKLEREFGGSSIESGDVLDDLVGAL